VYYFVMLFSDSWDNLVVAIGSTTQSTLKYEDVVASFLSEEMRQKSMDGHSIDALFVKGHTCWREFDQTMVLLRLPTKGTE
jgi:hypothetical protein